MPQPYARSWHFAEYTLPSFALTLVSILFPLPLFLVVLTLALISILFPLTLVFVPILMLGDN